MLKVLSSQGSGDTSLGDLLSSEDRKRVLALRVVDGEDVGPSQSPREEERYDSSGVAALRSGIAILGDTLNQKGSKTQEDLKKFSGDVKKKLLAGITGRKPGG